jgi:hypothetical protein
MRGSPILRAVLVVAALLLLLVPLVQLTKPVHAAPVAQSAPPAATSVVHLELTSTRAPFEFELRHLGQVIWSGSATENQVSKDVAMNFPTEGVDLELKGQWTGGVSMAAIKLSVANGEARAVEKSLWATKEFDDVLTFP